ncbi:hypothetical protein CH35J_009980 [Colletotrichum higginsianum]|uniref:BZIP transcription factor n=1 Tax=Colletotrichum higginsianum TaxID=80884 RepID=A0A4T0VLF3_9PEZI|nr:hypothetical protein CH35J_009980 [Colletotrichum higginsianum]
MASTPTSPALDTASRTQRNSQTATSQRLKKREYDRKAQRVAREKKKNRIAQLESLVEKLSHQDDNATTASLMAQLSRVTEQRNKLVTCLRTTSSVFSSHVREAETWGLDEAMGELPLHRPLDLVSHEASSLSPSATLGTASVPVQENDADTNKNQQNVNDGEMLLDESIFDIDHLLEDVVFESEFSTNTPPVMISQPRSPPPTLASLTEKSSLNMAQQQGQLPKCHCSSTFLVRRLSDGSQVSCNNWKAGNEILKEPFVLSNAVLDLEDNTSEDIPVHAVLHGWDSLAHSGRMTPLWSKVRQLDELCFSACGQTERLAVLFIIHLLMRAYADPGLVKLAVIPQWYLKSPLQEISHDPSADYFAWPALRYRFAVSPHQYCGNMFWHMFKEHLRIVWPYDFRDCYVRNVQLGTYGLSSLFKETVHNLRCWTMEPDFFDRFPELRQDIPRFPGTPSPAAAYQFQFGFSRNSTTSPGMDMFLTGCLIDPKKTGKREGEENLDKSIARGDTGQCELSAKTYISGFLLNEVGADDILDSVNL